MHTNALRKIYLVDTTYFDNEKKNLDNSKLWTEWILKLFVGNVDKLSIFFLRNPAIHECN